MNAGQKDGGFTLKELVAVLVLLVLAIALLLPAVRHTHTLSRSHSCRNNMKNLALSFMMYDTNHNHLPGFHDGVSDAHGQRFSRPLLYMILPYLERTDAYERYHAERHPHHGVPGLHLYLLLCPSAGQENPDTQSGAPSSYVFNTGMPDVPSADAPPDWPESGVFQDRYLADCLNIALPNNNLAFVNAGDGTANTALLSERREFRRWTDTAEYDVGFVWHPRYEKEKLAQINSRPKNAYAAPKYVLARPSSNHNQIVNVAFCDGHVRSIDEGVSYRVYVGLMTPKGSGAAYPGLREGKRQRVDKAFRTQPRDDEY